MSRQRFIYPELFRSEDIASLSFRARWLFVGCFATADDEGQRKASPASLKADVFPLDRVSLRQIEGLRDDLQAKGMIRLYWNDNGALLLDIPTWANYQHPKYTKPSHFPAYSVDAERKPGQKRPDKGQTRVKVGKVGLGADRADGDGATPAKAGAPSRSRARRGSKKPPPTRRGYCPVCKVEMTEHERCPKCGKTVIQWERP